MNSRLLISPLMEERDCSDWLTGEERQRAAQLTAPRRRSEFVTWRALFHRHFGLDSVVAYTPEGVPFVVGSRMYIGVSHSAKNVALVASDRPCAVDLESPDRNFARILSRYLSPDEQHLTTDPRWPAIAWCAKETLYKLARTEGLRLVEDLHILSVDMPRARLVARILDHPAVELSFATLGGDVAVWCF